MLVISIRKLPKVSFGSCLYNVAPSSTFIYPGIKSPINTKATGLLSLKVKMMPITRSRSCTWLKCSVNLSRSTKPLKIKGPKMLGPIFLLATLILKLIKKCYMKLLATLDLLSIPKSLETRKTEPVKAMDL